MKGFLIKITILAALLVSFDFILGNACGYIYSNAKGGLTYRDNFICNKLNTEILLCGSSRCAQHYNPKIITDSLKVTCYNSGQFGNGIILQYGRLHIIKHHKSPKLIIYDITPEFDLLEGEDNHRYLTWLKPHYDEEGIDDIFVSIDETERYKMKSQLYRYNSHIVEFLVDYLHPVISTEDNGYVPATSRTIDRMKIKEETHKNYRFDSTKLNYIKKFVELADDRIVFVVSPIWYGMEKDMLQPIKEISKKNDVLFLDYSNDPKYVHNDKLFENGTHLNSEGADEFTRDLIEALRRNNVNRYLN